MKIRDRISAFVNLGKFLNSIYNNDNNTKIVRELFLEENDLNEFKKSIESAAKYNGWFTQYHIKFSIESIAANLNEEDLNKWMINEGILNIDNVSGVEPKSVGVVLAGNIPLVGFHDFLCVLISGNKFIGKLSSNDKFLLPAISNILIKIEPGIKDYIVFTENFLKDSDAIIATGSNNSSRYFEYYFSKYPNIIRKNRNSIAILNGHESSEDLKNLCKDIFLYYGLGCRNVSKIYIPDGYSFNDLMIAANDFKFVNDNIKYFNNYNYNKSILIINKINHLDNGNVLFKLDESLYSSVSVINYEFYSDINLLKTKINEDKERIQCIISNDKHFNNSIDFGCSQYPKLWDYADGINVIKFLQNI